MKYLKPEEARETLSNKPLESKRVPKPVAHQYSNGATYKGEWRGGFRDGKGKMTWPDGASYEGDWELGKANGKGKFIHTDGDMYEGEWRNDRAFG